MNCMTNNEVSTGKSGNLKKEVCRPTRRTKDYYNLIKEINKLKIESAELEDVYYKKNVQSGSCPESA